MAPAWSLKDSDGAEVPAPPPPPPDEPWTGGLVMWAEGGVSEITSELDSNGDPRATRMTNLVAPINGDLIAVLFGLGDGPYTGLDTLDGKPSLTWRFDVDHTQNMNVDNDGAVMKDSVGAPLEHVGLSQALTFIAVLTPRFADNVFDITGGVVGNWTGSPGFQTLFDLEDNVDPDAFYVLASVFDWRSSIGSNFVLQGPDTDGGSGGVYDNVPLIVEWSTSGSGDFSLRINRVPVAATPATIDTTPTAAAGFILGNRAPGDQVSRFKGTMNGIFVWDFKLTDNVAAEEQTYAYLAAMYPSIAVP